MRSRNYSILSFVVLFCSFFLAAVQTYGGTYYAFGPENWLRSNGTSLTRNFNVINATPTYTLRVNNGGVSGQYQRLSSLIITINGVEVLSRNELNQNIGLVEKAITLQNQNQLTAEIGGKSGGGATVQIFLMDNGLPTISAAIQPAPNAMGWNNSNATVNFSCSDALSGVASCSAPVNLTNEGANQSVSGTAVDGAGNSASTTIAANIDKTVPALTIISPDEGAIVTTSQLSVSGTVSDALSGLLSITCNSLPATLQQSSFSCSLALDEGLNAIDVVAKDVAGNTSTLRRNVDFQITLPVDPATIAPSLSASKITTLGASSEFLYTGQNPIQQGVNTGIIQPALASVLRGRVLDWNGAPVSGVRIFVANRPEFGWTYSRADGRFDMAVNGGAPLTIHYRKGGFLPAQRNVDANWLDFGTAEDLIMINYDPAITVVDFSTNAPPMQTARGSVMSDSNGTRRATLIIPKGTATMILPDGTQQAVTSLRVQMTEYTVGPNGQKIMPATLPPNSGYTYCVELSAEEERAAGAKQVTFAAPPSLYVENFLNFPVGTAAPLGFYEGLHTGEKLAGSPPITASYSELQALRVD